MDYTDLYYNHFLQQQKSSPPKFNRDENFMMRFKAQLPYYAYEENSLTIIYFKEGSGNLLVKDQKVAVEGNKFIVSNPGDGWEYFNKQDAYIDVLSFAISNDLMSTFNFYCSTPIDKLLGTPFEKGGKESFFIERIYNADYYTSGAVLKHIHDISTSDSFVFMNAKELTLKLLQSLYQDQLNGYQLADRIDSIKSSTKLEVWKRLLIAYEYINDNIENKVSLEDLSKVAALSEHHLYDSFKKVFGLTPHKYVNRLKLAKAKAYLEQDILSISEIAEKLGFPDLPSFSKLFKKTFGYAPSQFGKSN